MILFEQTNFEIEWNIVTNLMLTNTLLQSNHKLDLCFTIACHSVVKTMARKQGKHIQWLKSLCLLIFTLLFILIFYMLTISQHILKYSTKIMWNRNTNNERWLFLSDKIPPFKIMPNYIWIAEYFFSFLLDPNSNSLFFFTLFFILFDDFDFLFSLFHALSQSVSRSLARDLYFER